MIATDGSPLFDGRRWNGLDRYSSAWALMTCNLDVFSSSIMANMIALVFSTDTLPCVRTEFSSATTNNSSAEPKVLVAVALLAKIAVLLALGKRS